MYSDCIITAFEEDEEFMSVGEFLWKMPGNLSCDKGEKAYETS